MIYVVLAGFLAFSVVGVHQNKAPRTVAPAIKHEKPSTAVIKKPRVISQIRVVPMARLDGIELKNLSDNQHA